MFWVHFKPHNPTQFLPIPFYFQMTKTDAIHSRQLIPTWQFLILFILIATFIKTEQSAAAIWIRSPPWRCQWAAHKAASIGTTGVTGMPSWFISMRSQSQPLCKGFSKKWVSLSGTRKSMRPRSGIYSGKVKGKEQSWGIICNGIIEFGVTGTVSVQFSISSISFLLIALPSV